MSQALSSENRMASAVQSSCATQTGKRALAGMHGIKSAGEQLWVSRLPKLATKCYLPRRSFEVHRLPYPLLRQSTTNTAKNAYGAG